jgi:hypothetical protein
MRIGVNFDPSQLIAKTAREERRLAFNCAEALNKTALAGQAAIRAHMLTIFHTRTTTKRNRKWLLEQVKLKFASAKKGLAFAELYLETRQRLLLAAFETGETRQPFVGKNVAVPHAEVARAGGSIAGEVVPALTFKGMKLKEHTTATGKRQFKGAARTFGIQQSKQAPLGGVFQRVGPGRGDIRLVYSFKRAFQLRKVLGFVPTAVRIMRDKFKVEWVIANARNPSK